MKPPTLADVYAAILNSKIDPTDTVLVADAGEITIYEDGEQIYRGSEEDAFIFVSNILGITFNRP